MYVIYRGMGSEYSEWGLQTRGSDGRSPADMDESVRICINIFVFVFICMNI